MFGDKLNLGSLLKNAKKMQEMVEQAQTELKNTEVTGNAGAGAVKIVGDEPVNHPEHVRHRYLELYQQCEGHRHIHGANLGICARAYQRAGGFSHLVAHEDVTLVRALEAIGARITWTARNTVCTSARKLARAPNGFSEYLNNLAAVS